MSPEITTVHKFYITEFTLIIITIQVRIHKQVLSEFNSAVENKRKF
jgi:hypothetical protein